MTRRLFSLLSIAPAVQAQQTIPIQGTITIPAPWTVVRGEVPVYVPATATAGAYWQLAHTPANGITAFRNGSRQSGIPLPGATAGTVIAADYTLSGSQITSSFWPEAPGDSILVDYEFLAGM